MNKNKPIIGLINLGCPKNQVDAEIMLGMLADNGYKINLDQEKADIIIINTCSFIKDAEKESVRAIVRLAESGKKIVITGCLAQKYKQELAEAVPEALAVIGTGDIADIVNIIDAVSKGKTGHCRVSEKPKYLQPDGINRFHISMGASAFIKIAEGCDYACSYCIIPALRGKYRSRTKESIINEAKKLAQNGVREIIITAQDTTSYGKDIYSKPSLPELLEKLNEISEISWIRIMYTFPSLIDNRLIQAIAGLDKVVKYIDIPLQHSHPDILRLMKRPAFDYSSIIQKLRDKIDDVAIRTAFITGFPGETEGHYEHLYDFIKTNRFDKLGVFEYSREKMASSYRIKGQIPAKIKKSRRNKLMELQQGISLEINKGFIGKTIHVIIETVDKSGNITGRSYRDAPEIDGLVYITHDRELIPGEVELVKITAADEYDLFGTAILQES